MKAKSVYFSADVGSNIIKDTMPKIIINMENVPPKRKTELDLLNNMFLILNNNVELSN